MATLNDITSSDWSLSASESGQVVQGMDDIRQCIRVILFTRPGEDPLRPLFGCDAYKYIDEPITRRAELVKSILDAVALWEPRVEVTKITSDIIDLANLKITIAYRIVNTVDTGQVDITYALTQ